MVKRNLYHQIVDTAMEIANDTSWEAVRLHDVADRLSVDLEQVHAHFREKEDIVDAWFDRADRQMLETVADSGLIQLETADRLTKIMMNWFDALAPYRHVTRQMIFGKLEFGHLHYQVLGAMRVSRTVQWMREAAQRDAPLPWRAIEETALTTFYLATFLYWMFDSSANSERTRRLLSCRLERAARIARCFPYPDGPASQTASPPPPST